MLDRISEAQLQAVQELSKESAVLKSANMSLGINLMFKVLKMISPMLSEEGFDIEILEKHHHRKSMHRAEQQSRWRMRSMMLWKRNSNIPLTVLLSEQPVDPKEIGFAAVRDGNIKSVSMM